MAEREKLWEEREVIAMPRASFEELEIHCADGTVLRALVDEPAAGVPIQATLVLAHALAARKTSFGRPGRPGLSSAFAARGFRTIAFDFRGHGDSKISRRWGYDDLVRVDLPSVVACARARAEDVPLVVVGHSLGGHVALAAQGIGALGADALVVLGANMWLRADEGSLLRWGVKAAVGVALGIVADRAGGIPARRLKLGSEDVGQGCAQDLARFVREGAWRSADRRDDYLASLESVKTPVAAIVGDFDRMCHPRAGEAFARRVSGPVRVLRAPVGHAGLVTAPAAHPFALEALEWVLDQLLP